MEKPPVEFLSGVFEFFAAGGGGVTAAAAASGLAGGAGAAASGATVPGPRGGAGSAGGGSDDTASRIADALRGETAATGLVINFGASGLATIGESGRAGPCCAGRGAGAPRVMTP